MTATATATGRRLVELNPRWLSAGGPGVLTTAGVEAPVRTGVGFICSCPCGCDRELYIPLLAPLDGGPPVEPRGWKHTGDSFETLTLSPSVDRPVALGGCGWHGWIENGLVRPA